METLRKNAFNYGLVLGLTLIVINALMYAVDLAFFTKPWLGIVILTLVTGFGVFSAIKNKNLLGGFITFKESFTSFVITVALGYFIATLFSILLFNVIDTEAKKIITDNIIKYSVDMMQNFGTKAGDVNQMIKKMKETDSFGMFGQLKSYAFSIVIYSIIGLLASLIIKRERTQSL